MSRITVSEAFLLYRDDVLVLKNQSLRTEESLLITMRVCERFFKTSIVDINPQDVREWHKCMIKKGLSVNTIRGYLFNLKNVITYCQLQGYAVMNPNLIVIPKRVQTVPEYLQASDISIIIDSIKQRRGCSKSLVLRDKAIIALLFASGLRASELCTLDRNDYDLLKATVLGKGNKPRLVIWDERTNKLLKKYIDSRTDDNPAMFVSNTGTRLNRHGIVLLFLRLQKTSGYPKLHAHTLRHSFAVNLMQGDMHIYTISRLMGHSNISTTSKYLHVSDLRLEEEYKRHHTI